MTDPLFVYVGIGNSDDKLPQHRWAAFIARTREAVAQSLATGVWPRPLIRGEWFSVPDSKFQNACWLVEFTPAPAIGYYGVSQVRLDLRDLATRFHQDSVAWAEVAKTEMIRPMGAS